MSESLIYGIFGGLLGSLYMGWVCYVKPPQFAMVDMQAVVAQEALRLAKSLPGDNALIPKAGPWIQEEGERLREGLSLFAHRHNVILLAKGAVAGGTLADKTPEILTWLGKGQQP